MNRGQNLCSFSLSLFFLPLSSSAWPGVRFLDNSGSLTRSVFSTNLFTGDLFHDAFRFCEQTMVKFDKSRAHVKDMSIQVSARH